MKNPLVSIIVPVYNAEKYIEESLVSVMKQTWDNLEIIVVDDGSTDGSLSIVKALGVVDPRIKLISLARGGVVKALNSGISMAAGKYIARMDADDICHPGRIKKQMDFLHVNRLDVCGCNIELFGAVSRVIKFPCLHDEIVTNLLTYGKTIPHPTVIARAEVFKLFSYSPDFPDAEDYAFWLAIALNSNFTFGNYPKPLLKYRVHENQVSREKKNSQIKSTAKALAYYLRFACQNMIEEEIFSNKDIARQKKMVGQSLYDLHLSYMAKLKLLLKEKNIDPVFFDKAIMRICKRSIAYKGFPLSRYLSLLVCQPSFFRRVILRLKKYSIY